MWGETARGSRARNAVLPAGSPDAGHHRRPFPIRRRRVFTHQHPQLCRAYGISQSVGWTGVWGDNAAAESFLGTLKKELVNRADYRSCHQARLSIRWWIEAWYNPCRLHSTIDFKRVVECPRLSKSNASVQNPLQVFERHIFVQGHYRGCSFRALYVREGITPTASSRCATHRLGSVGGWGWGVGLVVFL